MATKVRLIEEYLYNKGFEMDEDNVSPDKYIANAKLIYIYKFFPVFQFSSFPVFQFSSFPVFPVFQFFPVGVTYIIILFYWFIFKM